MPACADSNIWTERLRIHSYDVDLKHLATPVSLCRLFLEAAWSHAQQLGLGFDHLAAQNKFWVSSRLAVEFARYPRWGEELTLLTWPRGASSMFALRDFELMAGDERRLAAGSSAWVVLDASSRRPQRIQSLVNSVPASPHKTALNRDPEKLAIVENATLAMTTLARYSAVDVNSHVNSTTYIGWILDSYPMDFHHAYGVHKLEINFLGETRGGEEISVLTARLEPSVFSHSLVKAAGAEVCRARMVWVKLEP